MKNRALVSAISIAVLIAIMLVGYSNCGRIILTRSQESVSAPSQGDFCLQEPSDSDSYTKFLFVIDMSNSTNKTDPGGKKRFNSLRNFYNQYMNNQYVQWGLIGFNNQNSSRGYTGTDPLTPLFLKGSDPAVAAGINTMQSSLSDNGTKYFVALGLAQTAIRNDMTLFPNQSNRYQIFFLSDGQPTDVDGNYSALTAAVKATIGLSPGNISLSTAYFNVKDGSDIKAINTMQGMANDGGGKFVNFNDSPNLDFNLMIVPGPNKTPYRLKRLLVYNINSAICLNGMWDTDSDADGVCDKDENQYGLNALKRNSGQNNKYSDYFALRQKLYSQQPPICNLTSFFDDEDFDLLTPCEEMFIENKNPVGTDQTHGLPLNPDTDGDGILDGIEIATFKSTTGFPMHSTNIFDTFDGENVNALQQIVEHRNPEVPDAQVFRYDTHVVPTGVNALGQNCYHFSQNNLLLYPVAGVNPADVLPNHAHGDSENIILFYYIMTPENDPNSPGVLMYSYQKLLRDQNHIDGIGTAAGLKLDQFKSYIVPKVTGTGSSPTPSPTP